MKFSVNWLKEFLPFDVTTKDLAEELTMLGLEVDGIHSAAADFSGVTVGYIVACKQHPNADRLKLCEVDIGKDKPLSIVCGGANARQGIKVAVATIGAVLPGDFKIKKSKLRGETSEGMLCSESELGLAEQASGIMELEERAPIGCNIREYLQLDDDIIDIDLTPDRGDCLSVQGIARDIAAYHQEKIKPLLIKECSGLTEHSVHIHVDDAEACPSYAIRVIHGIDNSVSSPLWLQEKLRRCGLRSINAVVDVCNYVMLEIGQPMHAFDAAKLHGDITVRLSKQGETCQLLDESHVNLQSNHVVISDEKAVIALAGVMGGLDSAVTSSTDTIVLESALFKPNLIYRCSKQYGIQSDSSYRFERGVDSAMQMVALERATELLLDIVGGQASAIENITGPWPERTIVLRYHQIKRVLGVTIPESDIEKIIQSIGCVIKKRSQEDGEKQWLLEVPTHRNDMLLEVDIIADIARMYGYNNISQQIELVRLEIPVKSEKVVPTSRIRQWFSDRGYHECITYSFHERDYFDLFNNGFKVIELANMLSQDLAVMRSSLWPGLIKTALHNFNHQHHDLRLFEVGRCFWKKQEKQETQELLQPICIAGLMSGNLASKQWSDQQRQVDFFDMKADLEALWCLTGRESSILLQSRVSKHPALHPGRQAEFVYDDVVWGCVGELHPAIAQKLSITSTVYLFECLLEPLKNAQLASFKSISKYPGIRRDLAVVVADNISSDQLISRISEICGHILSDIKIFDIYQGPGIEIGKKKYSF